MAGESTTVGTIAVDIVARMDNLEKNLTAAGRQFAGFGGMVAGAAAAVTNFALEAGKAAAGAMVEFTKQTFNAIDAQSKLATTLGADIGALRAIQYAADLAGTSGEQLTTAFQKMSKTIGDGVAGEKAAQEAIAKLGLSVFDLAGMRGDQQFIAIAEAIAKIPGEAQRTAAAMEVFGKGAFALLPLITSDINAAKLEFENFGGAITKQSGLAVEAANDSITKVMTSLKVTLESIIVQLAPSIEKLANAFLKLGLSGEHAMENIRNAYQKILPILKIIQPGLFLNAGDILGGSGVAGAPRISGPKSPTLEENQKVWREQLNEKKRAEVSAAEEVAKRKEAAEAAFWAAQDAAMKKSYDAYMKEAQKTLDEEQARRDKAFQEHGTKKKAESKSMRSIGFAGVLASGGVSANALRQASKQVQVVTDPQLEMTNKLLTTMNSTIKNIGTGRAVTT